MGWPSSPITNSSNAASGWDRRDSQAQQERVGGTHLGRADQPACACPAPKKAPASRPKKPRIVRPPARKRPTRSPILRLRYPNQPPFHTKFELGSHGKAEEPRNIPWAYDYDRVTGMAVDPDHLFVYWEVTDQSLERARAGLGASGKDAWLNLRVYDSTGRIFDGTNAHSYFDHGLDRADRQWFFHVGKPSSSAFVDVGLKSREGYFIKIALPAASIFPGVRPHLSPSPSGSVCARPGARWNMRAAGFTVVVRPQHLPWARPRGPDARPTPPRGASALGRVRGARRGRRAEMVEWEEHFSDGHSEFHRQMSWESPVTISSWRRGRLPIRWRRPRPSARPLWARRGFIAWGAALTSCMAPGRWSSAGWGHTMAMRWLPVGRSSSLGSPMK